MREENAAINQDLRCMQLHAALAPRCVLRTDRPTGIRGLHQRIHLAHAGLDQITVQGSLRIVVGIIRQ